MQIFEFFNLPLFFFFAFTEFRSGEGRKQRGIGREAREAKVMEPVTM